MTVSIQSYGIRQFIKTVTKEKNAEAIIGINGINQYFYMLNFNLNAHLGQEKEFKKKSSDFLIPYYNTE